MGRAALWFFKEFLGLLEVGTQLCEGLCTTAARISIRMQQLRLPVVGFAQLGRGRLQGQPEPRQQLCKPRHRIQAVWTAMRIVTCRGEGPGAARRTPQTPGRSSGPGPPGRYPKTHRLASRAGGLAGQTVPNSRPRPSLAAAARCAACAAKGAGAAATPSALLKFSSATRSCGLRPFAFCRSKACWQ